ncbi:hypothetical protein ELI20_21095 [Rhizobium ruizarguesonis]|uniref:hypothetical protein n=1 Tax=Rhizobium ruizarguesonis TaxID=2081791 RepID=UPI00102F789E|nr:hypothetical protein [Rhizobium ruizarguesonis]TAU33348.1 hypothetical protein ELI47_20775 [Rhizobium ruizarguesonis]TAW23533.1 hypothetical protein ELI20_21095 [Rhizobium ruizarguesonis]
MTKVTNLPAIDAIADNDLIYVWDASDLVTPDKKATGSQIRPTGAKVTNYLRYQGNVTIPALAAQAEADATLTITGALVGDNVVFNLAAAIPGNIAILGVVVTTTDTVKVRFRNTHASVAFSTVDVACVALVIRHV